jgi:Na+/H+-dicarboxylate symporter
MSIQKDSSGVLSKWNSMPLYWRILIALVVGLLTGIILGKRALIFELPSKVILQLLGALAPPLILIAVTHVLMTTEISGKTARRLAGLLLLNTTVAILIGLGVANVMRPGSWSKADTPKPAAAASKTTDGAISPVDLLVQNVPKSILGPLGDKSNIIGVIIIAIAFGVGLRSVKEKPINNVQDVVEIAYAVLLKVLHWIIALVPLGVFAIVAKVVGTEGFAPFKAMGAFIVAVIVALLLQATWYLIRIRLFSWVRPFDVLSQMRDALFMAFSTDSSTATMPVTYACLKDKVGVREESASMGALVGANFNNDGTALYEAMSALFISQMIGQNLTITQQLIVILTSIIASVGAAGIPEAGLVTMTLVFTAVDLPIEYIALLLTVDWFLDRCRTTINVLGDVNVSCLLDGKTRQVAPVIPLATIPADG